ncbi:type II toxin-antitoxin system Phd/YefM family antitoxin [Streptomyces sp. NBC_01335]|uniref:type II toxin-antitoxin system Phd/YefM family antitoxin n=1 Tax=Streptomyces sp. NBC_01335 TaxID=2903828 RepID=UPI002E16235B|nr:type II toxin-antitoxin system Phd/YefM family antitoxin [Streptomyces sp. NBC_01335]
MKTSVTVSEARVHLARCIDRAERENPTVLTRNGVPVAAIVSITDFEALEAAADARLAREAEAVLARGGPTVTIAELSADLFADRPERTA